MPIIRVDFDGKQVQASQVETVSEAVRSIVSEVTQIEDVFVYGNDSQIKIKVAPIEIFVEMSDYKAPLWEGDFPRLQANTSSILGV